MFYRPKFSDKELLSFRDDDDGVMLHIFLCRLFKYIYSVACNENVYDYFPLFT